MNLFSKLARLYFAGPKEDRTPLENFTTEVLVGVLKQEPGLIDDYANEFLELPGKRFRLNTQKRYLHRDGFYCQPDITLENSASVCFIENKVNSQEGVGQLKSYSEVLNALALQTGKAAYLRYCTKNFYSGKADYCNFKHMRWSEIYGYLKKKCNSTLIKSFLDFLREENMGTDDPINYNDLFTMVNLQLTISKIENLLKGNVVDILEANFGKVKSRDPLKTMQQQLIDNNRCAVWAEGVFGKGYSEVLAAIQFSNMKEKSIPVIVVQCYCSNANSKAKALLVEARKYNKFDAVEEVEDGVLCYFQRELAAYIDSDYQQRDIQDWIVQKINQMAEFKKQSLSLNWAQA